MKQEMHCNYTLLNELAEKNGVVIFGGSEDVNIPLCELKQAFSLSGSFYNRSIAGLSVQNAKEAYDLHVSALQPECVLLHIGEEDEAFFEKDSGEFDRLFEELILHIQKENPSCEIALISLRNAQNSQVIEEMNRHIFALARQHGCQFGDLNAQRGWNPKDTQRVVSFVYSLGFVQSLKNKHPLGDVIRVLFCFRQAQAS